MSEIIKTDHLVFEYRSEQVSAGKLVLDDISLSIEKGEFVAVLGHNGSGKSTLAKHFNAILTPVSGKVYVSGMDTQEQEHLYDIRQDVGMVFQNPDNQIVATVVEDDVAFALENLGVDPKEIRQRVDDALKAVEMYEYRKHAPHQLSGGQKQRVAIAGIVAMRPECVVLDEPTAMLDPRGRREVLSTIGRLNKENGTTVVLITHYMDEAVKADRVVVVDNGKVLLDGIPKQVFKHVNLLKEVGLDVPQVTELAFQLREHGVNIPDDILEEEECVRCLTKLLEESNCPSSK